MLTVSSLLSSQHFLLVPYFTVRLCFCVSALTETPAQSKSVFNHSHGQHSAMLINETKERERNKQGHCLTPLELQYGCCDIFCIHSLTVNPVSPNMEKSTLLYS